MGLRDTWIEKRLTEAAGANGSAQSLPDALCAQGRDHRRDGVRRRARENRPGACAQRVPRGRSTFLPTFITDPWSQWASALRSSARSTRTSAIRLLPLTLREELKKLHHSVHYGARHGEMDLSTGGTFPRFVKRSYAASPVPIGTVPIYEALSRVKRNGDLSADLMLEVIEEQARAGRGLHDDPRLACCANSCRWCATALPASSAAEELCWRTG